MRYALSLIFALFGCSAGHPTTSVSVTPKPIIPNPGAAVFDVLANDHFRVRLRVDREAGGRLIGRFKNYAFDNSVQEGPEEDIMVTRWDGAALEFERTISGGNQFYAGAVTGDRISGTFTQGERRFSWTGKRAEILTYGLTEKTVEDRAVWQARTRQELFRLMMAGNPAPSSVNVEILAADQPPIVGAPYPLRDDEPHLYPQDYTLTELRLTCGLPGGVTRVIHAYLAKPFTGAEKYPLVVALNGHRGSAYKVMDGGTTYWYGDAWARRGYMVLSVDIGHRPSSDVARSGSLDDLSTYLGYPDDGYSGDDPEHGNGLRPAIPGFEENGERVWDVMRAIDYAVSRSDVDSNKIVVTGLSLGGEVASYVAALDERIKVVVIAGYSHDWSAFKYLWRVGHCWHWSFADIREYIDQSDILALIAPRPLIVETGILDGPSNFSPPFASAKQVIRRARVAGGPIFHYLHPLGHEYRTGVVTYTVNDDQVSAETATDGRNLFDWVRFFLGKSFG